jgi:carbon-monoxide dehydrogenase medium subunit
MYPDGFEYERASSVDEALDLLAEHSDADTELLAGGHSLLPTMKSGLASPEVLVDIGRIDELRDVEVDSDTATIGALTPYSEIEDSTPLRAECPVVAEAAAAIGDVQVRNMGTVGGNLAHADPASDMPASVLAADATVNLAGPDGSRSVAAEDFFRGVYETAVGEEEILTNIEVSTGDGNEASTYVKRPSPSSGYAMVGVGAAVRTDGHEVGTARVAVTGATDHAVRLGPVEEALTGAELSTEAIADAAQRATDDLAGASLMDDPRASSEFRAQLLEQYTQRALDSVAELA